MRTQVAVFSLATAVVLAAVALKANNFGQTNEHRESVVEEGASGAAPSQPTASAQAAVVEVAAAAESKGASPQAEASTAQTATGASTAASKESSQEGDGKAVNVEQLLGQVRSALGGADKLKEVRSLTAAAKMRRLSQNQDQSGTVTLDFLMPDKYKRTETLSLIAGIEVTLVKALNGDQVWTDSGSNSGSAQVMVSRPGGNTPSPTQLQDLRAEFSRYALALLVNPPQSLSVEYSYAGEAEAPDGRADVLDVKGANGFSLRLFIDKKTHRPLMMTYRGVAPGAAMSSSSVSSASKEDLDKIIKDAQAKAAARQQAEVAVSFSDYRLVNGIYLPHQISRSAGGKTIEEWQSIRYKINPADLKPQNFEKK